MVDRNHHFPRPDAPLCVLCGDGGLHRHEGEWSFCGCPTGVKLRESDPGAAKQAQDTLDRLERIGKR